MVLKQLAERLTYSRRQSAGLSIVGPQNIARKLDEGGSEFP